MIYIVQPEKQFSNPVDNKTYQAGEEVAIAPTLARGPVAAGVLKLKGTAKFTRQRKQTDNDE